MALLGGVILGWASPETPASVTIGGALCGLAGAAATFRADQRRSSMLLALAAFAACGLARGSAARRDLRTPLLAWYEAELAAQPRPGVAAEVEGRLRRDAVPTGYGASLTVDVGRLSHSGHDRAISGAIRVAVGGTLVGDRIGEWRAGRRVRFPVALRRPARYANPGVADQAHLSRTRRIGLLGSVKSGLLVDVVAPGSMREEWGARARAAVRRAVAQAVGVHSMRSAGIVTAVLIGDRAGLDADTTRRLQEGGTYHVIAISGGNIAILSGVLLLALRLLGSSSRLAAVTVIVCLLGYAQVVGPEASVARATFAAATFLAARAVDHRTGPLNTLALAAATLVVASPTLLFDPGFQLTFGATLGILVGVPRLLGRLDAVETFSASARRRVVAPLLGLFGATVCAELALLPIGATLFSRVSFAGLALNFVAIPLMTVAQLAGMVAAALVWVHGPMAEVVGWVAHIAAAGIVESTRVVDWAPWLVLRLPAPGVGVVAAYYLSWLVWLGTARRPQCRRLAAAFVAIACVVILAAPRTRWSGIVHPASTCANAADAGLRSATLQVVFLDVDQADATLVRFPGTRSLLVDTGGRVRGGFDVGSRVVVPSVWAHGVRRLDYLAVTHADPDHIGGAPSVVRDLRPREIWTGVPVPSSTALGELRALAGDRDAAWRPLRSDERVSVGGVDVHVLHPPSPTWERPRVRNDDSLVLELRYGDVSVVLPGDIGAEVEHALTDAWSDAALRVVKVPHHGSRSSSSGSFVATLRPVLAVVSAGRENRFGHPHPDVVRRYTEAGASVLATGDAGAITLCTDGRRVTVSTGNGTTRRFDAPALEIPSRAGP